MFSCFQLQFFPPSKPYNFRTVKMIKKSYLYKTFSDILVKQLSKIFHKHFFEVSVILPNFQERDRVSIASRWPLTPQVRTNAVGLKEPKGGPLILRKSRLETFFNKSFDRFEVMTSFNALNPLSHSAVLTGKVFTALTLSLIHI